MKYFVLLSFAAVLALGCSTDDEHPAGIASAPGNCRAESQCAGCASCFDACRCGGGTTARCAEECGAAPQMDAGTDAPASAPGKHTATVVMDAFDIPAGEEYFRCQNFANPFGRDVAVLSSETFMTAGSHHLFVFMQQNAADGPLEKCSGLEFGSYLHLSQQSQQRTTRPPGVGTFFSHELGFRVQVHYLNTSPDPVHVEIAVTVRADDPLAVPMLASQLFINTGFIDVPAFSPGHARQTCKVPKDINLYTAGSHMHKHGTYFTARTSDGQLLYETNEWEEPEPWTFDPPRRLKAGTEIQIDCDYRNDTASVLRFGESADTNEMCIFAGNYFPGGPLDAIGCLL